MSSSDVGGNGADDQPVRVLIVDDHQMVRAGLRMILEDEVGFDVVGEAADGSAALEQAALLLPAVVLADVRMPPPDGIELARLLGLRLPAIRTIIFSMHEDDDTPRQAFAAGAVGYVLKRSGPQELIHAIRRVAAGEIYLDTALPARLAS